MPCAWERGKARRELLAGSFPKTKTSSLLEEAGGEHGSCYLGIRSKGELAQVETQLSRSSSQKGSIQKGDVTVEMSKEYVPGYVVVV